MAAQRASDASPYAREQHGARVGWAFIALVRRGVPRHQSGLHRSAAGDPGSQGQLAGGRRPGAASLSLVAATGSLVALVANPLFGRLSDRTTSRWGMRRPWILVGLAGGSVGILVVALAPAVWVVLIGWCLAQLFFNAMLAAIVAVLPDQVPVEQRGTVAGVLGVCLPVASVGGHLRGEGLHGQRAGHVHGSMCHRRRSSSSCSRCSSTTAGSPRRTSRRGR